MKSSFCLKNKSVYLLPVIAGFFLISISSCKKHVTSPKPVVSHFQGVFSGSAEVPSVKTKASGTLSAKFDPATMFLSYYLTWSTLSSKPTAIEIYTGIAGKTGALVYAIRTFPKKLQATLSGVIRLTTSQENELMRNRYYINILTSKDPKGELRAQIIKK